MELMREVRAGVSLPIFAMVRPRGGNFLYSAAEFEEMKRSIEVARSVGMDGVVFGLLRDDRSVDVERTAELVRAAVSLPVTFHRAFDECADLLAALEDVVATGAARLLTSGGAAKAPEAVGRIAELVRRAPDLGALGATISGAGPSVLVWVERGAGWGVAEALRERAAGWAEVLPVAFEPRGAEVTVR